MKLDNRIWILVASILCIGLVAGGWFVGIAPRLTAAASADAQRSTVEAQNDSLRSEIARLTVEQENMPAHTAQLAGLQKSVPPGPYGSRFIAELNNIVTSTGVLLESVSIAGPARYEPPNAPEAPADPAAEAPEGEGAEEAPALVAPVDTPKAPGPLTDGLISSSNFLIVPISIAVSGSNEQLLAFLGALQSAERLTLVTSVSISQESGAEGAPGGAKLEVGGDMYVLESSAVEALTAPAEG